MSCDHKVCICYFRFLNFVICYTYKKLGIYKGIHFSSDKCITKSCCFFPNHLSSTRKFPESCLTFDELSFESFVDQLQIIKSVFCSIDLGRCKSPILYPFPMVQAYVAWHWIFYVKILLIRQKV